MATSQNGWPANPARRPRQVPGGQVRLIVADGPAGDVLMYVAAQFDKRVEDLDTAIGGTADDWGWAHRPIKGGTALSNHASATAVDLNATRHPLGEHGTFSRDQVREIHRILAEVDGVVRWGGDYRGRKDEMHFEINADAAAVAAVAARLGDNQEDEMAQQDVDNIQGFLWKGGPSTITGDGSIAPESIMGRLQNLEGFVFRGGASTADHNGFGVSVDSLMGRAKRAEQELEQIRALLQKIASKVGA